MKKVMLATIVATLALSTARAQTIPFSFKKSKLYNPTSETQDQKSQQQQGGTSETASQMEKRIYSNMAKKIEDQATAQRKQITDDYEKKIKQLSTPTTPKELEDYQLKVKQLQKDRDDQFKNVEKLDAAVIEYKYRAKTSDWFNIFFIGRAEEAEIYYNGTVGDSRSKILNNTLLSFSTDGGQASLFNEIYSDYAGPVRVGLGAMISNKQSSDASSATTGNESQKDAVQRLLGGGGNAVLNFSYPIIDAHAGQTLFFKCIAAPKLGIDLPKIGSESNSFATNYNLGAEGSLFLTSEKGIFTVFTNFRFARVYGNGVFYDNLKKADKSGFGFNQFSVGLAITSTFRVSYNTYFGSGFVKDNFHNAISFSIIPN